MSASNHTCKPCSSGDHIDCDSTAWDKLNRAVACACWVYGHRSAGHLLLDVPDLDGDGEMAGRAEDAWFSGTRAGSWP